MRACFRMLDENIADQFKVSNIPTLIGWNASMTIQKILNQLDGMYGKPDTMTLITNDTHFQSPFNSVDAPESLFYKIQQCQKIQVLAQDPYTDTRIINNAIRLFMQSSIFPLKEFDDWEAITPKTYPALKTFIRAAYTRHILAMQLHNMAGKMGYTPQNHNLYNTFGNNDDTTATKNEPTKLTTGSSITGGHTAATIQDWSSKPSINSAPINTH
jgi:hypothetical protein